jgi:hypothetical protein
MFKDNAFAKLVRISREWYSSGDPGWQQAFV